MNGIFLKTKRNKRSWKGTHSSHSTWKQPDIKAAEAELNQAKLDLERRNIKAPFDLLIMERMITEGAQVNSQTIIANLVAAVSFWVEAALPYQQLSWLSVENVTKSPPPVIIAVLFGKDSLFVAGFPRS